MKKQISPLYQTIKNSILLQIENQTLLPGDRLPTEIELANKYGVSRITVTNALNELREERILVSFPRKGTFVASSEGFSAPREICPDELMDIACILPFVTDQFSLSMINGARSVFPESSYVFHFFQSRTPETEEKLLLHCMQKKFSGILLFPQYQPFRKNQAISLLMKQNMPLVLMDCLLPDMNASCVISDNRAASALCLKHLYDMNHQHFCFVTSSERGIFSIGERIAGMMDKALAYALPAENIHLIEHLNKGRKYEYYEETFFKLIRQDRVTAFIAGDSPACSYLYHLLSGMHVSIPEDVSLISFDQPIVENVSPDFFTYITQSPYQMGREAGIILKNQIEQHNLQIIRRVVPPHLKIRSSTREIIL